MYLALARKYRPQKFAELIGQASISKTLQNAIAMNKVYPALIFSGMKGVGKTSSARILAKALNCEKGPAIEPCNQCQTCMEITEDNSADYMEIDGASNNGVNEVRSLRETVKYKPLKNRFRIVVIDEVHMLSNAAWNALLKTIEEPPEHTIFIMATTDFHKIPATIVSRCQHFEFKRIPFEVIKQVLKDICQKETIKISEYSLYLIAKSAEGSLRDAKKILDQAIAISRGDVKDDDVVAILGIIAEETFIILTRHVFSQNRKGIIEQINQLIERGTDLRFFYTEYLRFIRDVIVIKSIPDAERLHNLNPENITEIKDIVKGVNEVELLRFFNAVKELEQTIRNTEHPSIILEYMFLKLSYFSALVSIEEYLKKIKDLKPTPLTTTAPSQARPLESPPAKVGDGDWLPELKTRIEKEKPRLASVLSSSSLVVRDNALVIEVGANFENAGKMLKENKPYLLEVVQDLAGKEIGLEVVLQPQKTAADESRIVQDLKSDKKIKSLKDKIKGNVIAVESVKGGKDA
ncbi:MAG: DNA polymerase III subunit gamma/tau [Acidobacteria bacterium]|nr:DNA polymerase III subunit gamma/tau [Acidobacteriota bacterium]MBU4306348.1 DNA polymerase III subunit gamma/tau [Acidobacteriota bacterium]MBU4405533.1 DNA polymerase III subunit gamma/tau [Acidobacteriota bacterium]MCG2810757.1 DNA polymerase III subunit gamma/tau [Candidatus Aminicenantes bacterium]